MIKRFISVVIITRNRLENLSKFLDSLQNSNLIEYVSDLVILDNCSDYDVSEINQVLHSKNFPIPCDVVVNKLNYGAAVNVLKAFEYARSDYVLPMGDSKLVNPEFKIRNTHYLDEPAFVNYHFSDRYHNARHSCANVEDESSYLSLCNSFGDVLLYGNTIYSRKYLDTSLSACWAYLDSHCTQVILQLKMLRDGGMGKLVADQLLSEMLQKPKSIEDLSILDCYVGFTRLFEVVNNNHHSLLYDLIFGGKSIYPLKYLWASILLEARTLENKTKIFKLKYIFLQHSIRSYFIIIILNNLTKLVPPKLFRYLK